MSRKISDRLAGRSGAVVVLLGQRGNGKTQICHDLLPGWAISPVVSQRPRYATARSLFRDIRSAFGSDGRTEKDVFESYVSPALLVVDEIQVRGETQFEDQTITELVDARYASKRDTILIANLTREEAAKSLGASIVSRIHEVGEVYHATWESFRETKK